MNFLIALTVHALAGAFVGSRFEAPIAGLCAALAAYLATTLVWCFLPEGDEEC